MSCEVAGLPFQAHTNYVTWSIDITPFLSGSLSVLQLAKIILVPLNIKYFLMPHPIVDFSKYFNSIIDFFTNTCHRFSKFAIRNRFLHTFDYFFTSVICICTLCYQLFFFYITLSTYSYCFSTYCNTIIAIERAIKKSSKELIPTMKQRSLRAIHLHGAISISQCITI